ncbi:site-specific recombinase, DNA invertase Pin [Desulfosporosinus acidiphilus SJ4]|uniref:Site-specific recombinase, DNA invertase Pin n=1 Tax=Desulfosporosinus acidiphilus (strain DSM 22704 / JCM 16185 / SJ4) TaxID=646529 RepID=I4D3J3_DESAJ|nr:recombinase family protein [Desulfosporosinus acidiphilus]AFM40367.1 site-specific recombinase, DNA invertase Pin [Desulfosporosinus acidiphilus SJ4]
MATVTVIPAKPMQELKGLEATAKLRVCAYARVSTDNEEQLSSYQAQVEHYTSYIQNNPAWEFVEIFSDEGISGTNTKKREGFNRMIDECMAGKIDMVITKSISRFARNTLDTLKYVRQLKEKGVAIFFEKEVVNTLDSKGEFLITLLGSLAQEESSNLSQITKMGISYRFQEGKVLVNHNKFLGYTKDEQGQLVIVPEEAEVVRRIYREFLDGKSPYKIASNLQKDGLITGAGGTKWYDSTVIGILKNVKYMGDALLQKTYTVDFLTKKRVKNTGHAAQYYVEDSHEAIISKEEFAAVQAEFERRANMRGYSKTGKSKFTSDYAFSGKLFCGNCGSKFRRSKWGSGKNLQIVWICINHQTGGDCDMKPVKEKALEQAFVRAMNRIIANKEAYLTEETTGPQFDFEAIDSKIDELQQELIDAVRNNQEYSTAEIERLQAHKQRRKNDEAERAWKGRLVEDFKSYLDARDGKPLDKFDGDLFRKLVEKVRVVSMVEVDFVFRTVMELREVLS